MEQCPTAAAKKKLNFIAAELAPPQQSSAEPRCLKDFVIYTACRMSISCESARLKKKQTAPISESLLKQKYCI